jgi:hypothetical protein
MTRARLLFLLVVCAVWPATAHGQSETADWLQGGSGPGPYNSIFTGYEVRVWCLPTGDGVRDTAKGKVWNCLLDDPARTKAVLSFGQDWASSGNARLFVDDLTDVRDIKESISTIAFTYRANPYFSYGGTVEFMHFSSDQGNAFSTWRLGLGPRLVFTPLAGVKITNPRWSSASRLIHLQVDTTYLPQGLKASDFGNTVSRYDPGRSFQVRTTLAIDYAFVLQAIHR